MKTVRVLLAEHDEQDFASITRLLAHSTRERSVVERVATIADALALWNDADYDVCVVDAHDDAGIVRDVGAHLGQCGQSIPTVVLIDGDEPPPDALPTECSGVEFLPRRELNMTLLVHAMRYARERRRFAQSTRREMRFKAAFEGSLDAIFFYEPVRQDGAIVDFRFTEMNAPGERLVGRPARDVIGKTLLDIAPDSRASGTLDKMIAIVNTGVPLEEQASISVPGISASWLHRQMVRLGDGVVTSARDISAQKQNEKMLAQARDLITAVLEAASDAFVMCDPGGGIMLTNHAADTFFGLGDDPIDPALLSMERMFGQVEDAPTFLARLHDVFGTPEREAHGEIVVAGMEPRTLAWTSSPVRGDNTTILGRVLVFRDITKEREADQIKAEFVGRVSHELRTPLTSIKGFMELILEGDAGPISDDVREFLQIAYQSSELLISIVNDILDVTRLDAHTVVLDRRLVNLATTVERAAQSLQPLIAGRGQRLRIDIPADLPAVYADAERLNQIMINLINNAHKYTADHGSLAVRARKADAADAPDSPMVVVEVTDTGVGITPKHHARIFDRFYRVASLETQQVGGTGLGLAIVRSLVELHDGKIWVCSEPGNGSTFSFTLPAMLSSHPAPPIVEDTTSA